MPETALTQTGSIQLTGGNTMRTRNGWLAAAATVVLTAAVALQSSAASAESNGGVRVMPLGDSITEGTQVPGGYRIGL